MALETASLDELKRITGLQRPSAIKRYLIQQRIPFIVGADGWPRVLSVIIAERMGGSIPSSSREPQLRLRNG